MYYIYKWGHYSQIKELVMIIQLVFSVVLWLKMKSKLSDSDSESNDAFYTKKQKQNKNYGNWIDLCQERPHQYCWNPSLTRYSQSCPYKLYGFDNAYLLS